jgi:hypothetical protein
VTPEQIDRLSALLAQLLVRDIRERRPVRIVARATVPVHWDGPADRLPPR